MFTAGLSALQHSFTWILSPETRMPPAKRIAASKRRTKRRRDMQVKCEESVSNHVPLKTSIVQGKSKGGRPMDPACDAWRWVLYVPAYGIGNGRSLVLGFSVRYNEKDILHGIESYKSMIELICIPRGNVFSSICFCLRFSSLTLVEMLYKTFQVFGDILAGTLS